MTLESQQLGAPPSIEDGMSSLVTYHFLFKTEVVTPLELDDHSGSALRGNLFEAVWKRFCTNKAAESCAACPLHTLCPVSALVAPLREEHQRGRDIPRPYILLPPLNNAQRYAPGEPLTFGLTLFGNIIKLFPYIILSLEVLEAAGLGRALKENRGQRGRFVIKQIESYHPFTAERRIIYEKGAPQVQVPSLAVNASEVQARAMALSTERLTLNFLTPTRLIEQEQPVRRAAFLPLVHRLLKRLESLEESYGEGSGCYHFKHFPAYLQAAEGIQCVKDETGWKELSSYSHRQHRASAIGGIMGKATFAGDFSSLRELLTWGELVHVGKNCVKGAGWYRIES